MVVVITSLIGALEKFPYLTIPFIIAATILCNFIFVKLGVPAHNRWILVAVSTAVIVIAVVVPFWLLYSRNAEHNQMSAEKDFWAQFPVSPTEAIQRVAALPEVEAELSKVRPFNYSKREADSYVWENIPAGIPAMQNGDPMMTFSTSRGADALYSVYLYTSNDEIVIYDVNPSTGAIQRNP